MPDGGERSERAGYAGERSGSRRSSATTSAAFLPPASEMLRVTYATASRESKVSVCSGAILVLAVAASICGAGTGRIRSCAARRPLGSLGRLREWSAHQASHAAEKSRASSFALVDILDRRVMERGAAASSEGSPADLDHRSWRPRNACDRRVEGARAVRLNLGLARGHPVAALSGCRPGLSERGPLRRLSSWIASVGCHRTRRQRRASR